MRFGFDIDDTLIDLRRHAFHLYNEHFQTTLADDVFEAIQRVEIHEPFGLTDEEGYEMWKSQLEKIYFTNCPIFPGAKEMLQQLVREGHEVFYITARPKQYCEASRKWMEEQGFPIAEGHFFCGMADDEKLAIIQRLQLDIYVDDKPTVLRTLSGVKTKSIIRDQSYNKAEHWLRLTDWSQFKEIVK